jgi:LmbE family N-acetylglucosaminyl deacetylase
MIMSMSQQKYNLICVAHPDDETIFFGGLILNRGRRNHSEEELPWRVICCTSDGDADRRRQFSDACRELSVEHLEWWAFPDKYEQRLPIDRLIEKLRMLPVPHEIYTHGIVGEYGHPHHQDVSYAVHHAFSANGEVQHPRLYSVSYNTYPEFEIKLSPDDFARKTRILTQVYGSETRRFMNVLPSTFVEGYLRLSLSEVEAIYDYLARGKDLATEALKANRGVIDYLPHLRSLPRPF